MSERYYNSRQSNLDKAGEPANHLLARERIKKILEALGFEILAMVPEEKQDKKTQLNITFPPFDFKYTKGFDIVAQKRLANGIKYRLIVEIDGNIHEKPRQQNRDIKAKDIAEVLFENIFFVRILKEFVINPHVTADQIIKELGLDFLIKYRNLI